MILYLVTSTRTGTGSQWSLSDEFVPAGSEQSECISSLLSSVESCTAALPDEQSALITRARAFVALATYYRSGMPLASTGPLQRRPAVTAGTAETGVAMGSPLLPPGGDEEDAATSMNSPAEAAG